MKQEAGIRPSPGRPPHDVTAGLPLEGEQGQPRRAGAGRGGVKHHSCCSRVCSVLESAAALLWLGPGQAAHLAVVRAWLVHEGAVLAGPHGCRHGVCRTAHSTIFMQSWQLDTNCACERKSTVRAGRGAGKGQEPCLHPAPAGRSLPAHELPSPPAPGAAPRHAQISALTLSTNDPVLCPHQPAHGLKDKGPCPRDPISYCRAARWWPTALISSRSVQAPRFWSSQLPATS